MAPSSHQSPMPPLIPPFRYALVEEGFHRGAHPSLKNMRYMRRLKLRTIISLIPDADNPSSDLVEFCKEENINHIIHQLAKYNDGFTHTPELVATILAQVLDPANRPVFLHCLDGRQNTGLVIMCLRKLQNWCLSSIIDEFRRYTKSNDFTFEEQQFVQTFSATVMLPETIPPWLRNAQYPYFSRFPHALLSGNSKQEKPDGVFVSQNSDVASSANSSSKPVVHGIQRIENGTENVASSTGKVVMINEQRNENST